MSKSTAWPGGPRRGGVGVGVGVVRWSALLLLTGLGFIVACMPSPMEGQAEVDVAADPLVSERHYSVLIEFSVPPGQEVQQLAVVVMLTAGAGELLVEDGEGVVVASVARPESTPDDEAAIAEVLSPEAGTTIPVGDTTLAYTLVASPTEGVDEPLGVRVAASAWSRLPNSCTQPSMTVVLEGRGGDIDTASHRGGLDTGGDTGDTGG